MEGVNNKTLLAWSNYEVIKAQTALHSVEVRNKVLEETVRAEQDEEQMEKVKVHLRELGVPAIVYNMATNVHELLVMVTDKKAFLRRCGVSEEDLEPENDY